MRILTLRVCLMGLLLTSAGCRRPGDVQGGTPGTLRIGQEILSDMKVTLYRPTGGGFETVGFGVTDVNGKFQILAPGAKGKLWLTPGEYRVTVQTDGAPIDLPKEYLQPESSPIKVTWGQDSKSFDVHVPELTAAQPK